MFLTANFDRMKEMLDNDHLLLHVSFDWGGEIMKVALRRLAM